MREKLKALQETPIGRFLACLVQRFNASRPPILAAALAYYAAISIGPLLILVAGAVGIFLRDRPELAAQTREAITVLVVQGLPFVERGDELAEHSFDVLLAILQEGTWLTAAFSVLVLLWSGSHFFTSLQLALEVIFASADPRPFWRQRLIAFLLISLIGLAIGVEVMVSVVLSAIEQALERMRAGLTEWDPQTWYWLQHLRLQPGLLGNAASLAMLTIAFTLSFRYIPKRGSTWSAALLGALFAVSTTMLARQVMLQFIDREHFNIIYGLITTLILLLLWFYLSIFLYLLGAVLAAELGLRKGHRHKEEEPPHLLEDEHIEEAHKQAERKDEALHENGSSSR
jgi:membrane protein